MNKKLIPAVLASVFVMSACSFGGGDKLTEEDFSTCNSTLSTDLENSGGGLYKNTRKMNSCLVKKAMENIGKDEDRLEKLLDEAKACQDRQFSGEIGAQHYIDRYTHFMKEDEMIKKAGGDDEAIAAIKKFYETEEVSWAGRKEIEMAQIHTGMVRKDFMQCLNKNL
ncbi:hypothetical protein I3271_07225 [Photobacterium leiognathi]|uniref:hypothetical protein n=1 Tax=Photobacterium leiognathi TaxID=553611 RepID=UPI001EE1543D|nr:hypothetical protein [Photobacterium leiognathi]MCG3884477.1 hypothetical protein [Photobacterium leiognathi]